MRRRLLHPLDRYVLAEFSKILVTTALGFPIILIVIDLTDKLDRYLNRRLPPDQIALSYLYWIPDSMFMVLPAAVLFATVFSIGAFTRHSEITAAKASGISFHRFVAPIFIGALGVTVFALALGEVVPLTNAKRSELLEERRFRSANDRFNFAYAADEGRVYKVSALNVDEAEIDNIEIERKGSGPAYPTYLLTAQSAAWDSTRGWLLQSGQLHLLPDSASTMVFAFDSLRDRGFAERPLDLLATPRSPQEMRYQELAHFIAALKRSGAEADELTVELAHKIAIPVTCIIIAIFGAPLVTSTQRGGAAYGVAISLGTTVVFLMMIQITKAVGSGGAIPPTVAAWIPSAFFGVVGLILLIRART